MPLTDTELKKAKPREKSYKLFDGGGLYIEITPNGSKGWRYKYRINGKEKRISLGVYPEVSLKDARFRHSEQRQLVSQGVDPSEKRKATKLARSDGMGNSGVSTPVATGINTFVVLAITVWVSALTIRMLYDAISLLVPGEIVALRVGRSAT
jgi:hypothetical protein